MLGCGTHACIGAFTGQLVDEEDEGTDTAAQRAVGAGLLLLDDLLEPFLELAGDDELVGLLVVNEVGGDDGAQGSVRYQAARLMGDAVGCAFGRRCRSGRNCAGPVPRSGAAPEAADSRGRSLHRPQPAWRSA
jgi:hypothetical protein